MTIGLGFDDRYLSQDEVRSVVREALASLDLAGKRVLVIIPDGTRSMPMPMFHGLFRETLRPRVESLDYLVALGTHRPMTDAELGNLLGRPGVDGLVDDSHIYNHEWADPETFVTIGTITAAEIRTLTGGLFDQDVAVPINRLVREVDQIIICGPVFPHEVAGFSGGNKYLFPGVAGPEIIDFTHWLGAVITSHETIGVRHTPVRAVIDRAATFLDRPVSCFSLVATHDGLHGLYFGAVQEAWEAAADLSSRVHVVWLERPLRRALAIMPDMYTDLWTAAKGMYKLEPAISDGGEIVIYAPHVDEVSYTHGETLDQIGYHCRDYFLKQWDRFKEVPGAVLAHSTHGKGLGAYDPSTGTETPRIRVTLATGISKERCERLNLGYLDPASVDPAEWSGRGDEGILLAPRAGETLYRVACNH